MKHAQLAEVLSWVGHPAVDGLHDRLTQFEGWLESEGVAGGGIGPGESDVWQRHVLDSLMFARGIPSEPTSILDLGSGVGLPGIPLALLFPEARVMLVDRSGRRMQLARRAGRVLRLGNLETVVSGFDEFDGTADVVTMRAALRPATAVPVLLAHVRAGGSTVLGVGGERSGALSGLQERFPGSGVLDPGRWLHIMRG